MIAPRLGDPQFALPPARSYLVLRSRSGEQHAQSISRPGQLYSKIESGVFFGKDEILVKL